MSVQKSSLYRHWNSSNNFKTVLDILTTHSYIFLDLSLNMAHCLCDLFPCKDRLKMTKPTTGLVIKTQKYTPYIIIKSLSIFILVCLTLL